MFRRSTSGSTCDLGPSPPRLPAASCCSAAAGSLRVDSARDTSRHSSEVGCQCPVSIQGSVTVTGKFLNHISIRDSESRVTVAGCCHCGPSRAGDGLQLQPGSQDTHSACQCLTALAQAA